jgi:hypothetical protein
VEIGLERGPPPEVSAALIAGPVRSTRLRTPGRDCRLRRHTAIVTRAGTASEARPRRVATGQPASQPEAHPLAGHAERDQRPETESGWTLADRASTCAGCAPPNQRGRRGWGPETRPAQSADVLEAPGSRPGEARRRSAAWTGLFVRKIRDVHEHRSALRGQRLQQVADPADPSGPARSPARPAAAPPDRPAAPRRPPGAAPSRGRTSRPARRPRRPGRLCRAPPRPWPAESRCWRPARPGDRGRYGPGGNALASSSAPTSRSGQRSSR